MSSSEGSGYTPRRAILASVSSGAQTLDVPLSPLPSRLTTEKAPCTSNNCSCKIAVDCGDASRDPIQADDLFKYQGSPPNLSQMAATQQKDPVWHMVQSLHGQAGIVLRDMERDILAATKDLMDRRQNGCKNALECVQVLRRAVPERAAFAASLATLEALQQPSQKDVRAMVLQYPTGEHEGRRRIAPSTSAEQWKSLRRVTRQKRLADNLPLWGDFGRLLLRPFRVARATIHDEDDREVFIHEYNDRYIEIAVLIVCSLFIGALVCVPIVILGVGISGSIGGRLAVIVSFIVTFGVGSAWWLEDPAIGTAVMIGFAAVLVNVSI